MTRYEITLEPIRYGRHISTSILPPSTHQQTDCAPAAVLNATVRVGPSGPEGIMIPQVGNTKQDRAKPKRDEPLENAKPM
jgi:hypothetical protein